jgi:hypothetical protein
MPDTAHNSPSSRGELSRLVGLILIVIGTLWLVTTGLCSAVFAIGLTDSGNLNDLGVVLTIGVPSALIGAAIYATGRWLRGN